MLVKNFSNIKDMSEYERLKFYIVTLDCVSRSKKELISEFVTYLNSKEDCTGLEWDFVSHMRSSILNLCSKIIPEFLNSASDDTKNSLILELLLGKELTLNVCDLYDIGTFLEKYSDFISISMLQDFMLICLEDVSGDIPF